MGHMAQLRKLMGVSDDMHKVRISSSPDGRYLLDGLSAEAGGRVSHHSNTNPADWCVHCFTASASRVSEPQDIGRSG